MLVIVFEIPAQPTPVPSMALSAAEPNGQLAGRGRPQGSLNILLRCPHPHKPPDPAQEVTNHRSLCSTYRVVLGQSQAAANFGLHRSLT